jgi:hypothetical protein
VCIYNKVNDAYESFAQMVRGLRNQAHDHLEMESESHQHIRSTLWRSIYKLSLNS